MLVHDWLRRQRGRRSRSGQQPPVDGPVLPKCHTRFRMPWIWGGSVAVLQSRCTDETGYVQPTLTDLVRVRGAKSVYHLNAIQSWHVAATGEVTNVHA